MPTTFAVYIGKGTIFDQLTRWASRCNGDLPICSHIELLYSPLPSPSAFCIAASKRDGYRVRTKSIQFRPDHWRFWTFHDMDSAITWKRAMAFINKPYDLWGAIRSVTPFPSQSQDKVFCSEHMGIVCDMPRAFALTPSDWERRAIQRGAEMTILKGSPASPPAAPVGV